MRDGSSFTDTCGETSNRGFERISPTWKSSKRASMTRRGVCVRTSSFSACRPTGGGPSRRATGLFRRSGCRRSSFRSRESGTSRAFRRSSARIVRAKWVTPSLQLRDSARLVSSARVASLRPLAAGRRPPALGPLAASGRLPAGRTLDTRRLGCRPAAARLGPHVLSPMRARVIVRGRRRRSRRGRTA